MSHGVAQPESRALHYNPEGRTEMRIPISFHLPERFIRQGILFDLAVFLANAAVVGPLTDLVRRSGGFHPLFGALMVAAFASYTLGAWLKGGPMRGRMAARGGTDHAPWARGLFGFLMLLLYCLMAAMLIFPAAAFGIWPGDPAWVRVAAGLGTLGLALLPTALTLRAVVPPGTEGAGAAAPSRRYVEPAANMAIYFAVIVIMAWWEGVFVSTLVGAGRVNPAAGLLLALLVTVPFAMFYLAPRLLFLVEDYRSPWTWPGVLLAMVPLGARIIFG